MGDGEMGERAMATGDGMLSDKEGRVEVVAVEIESESLGLTAREASMLGDRRDVICRGGVVMDFD